MLKLDPHSFSWWINGPGCQSKIDTSESYPQLQAVTDCLLDYRYVEIIHAGVQCFLAVSHFVVAHAVELN